ncbi:hypothetical protein EMWEY_00021010 [Eimeria maxima]|uniref:Uncharacterized protein n=1 Tax=Eimeria maxima TaxID=5804 RepID=U6M0L7_EIMMA|nr:hypothetical protein EMWEY_00021010 [Eimeria maxima]CDJ56623.1 hypothetical protein EMWEY_00021010 [Eimeria maxima]
MPVGSPAAPLTDQEREELRQRLQQRRQELQQQQQHVRQLQGRATDAVRESVLAYGNAGVQTGEETDISQSVASLLHDVLTAVHSDAPAPQQLPAAAAAAATTAAATADGQGPATKALPVASSRPGAVHGAAALE